MDVLETPKSSLEQVEIPDSVPNRGDLAGTNALFEPLAWLTAVPVSGLYLSVPKTKFELVDEELRLDVDGSYPQMVASGTISWRTVSANGVHWIANLVTHGGARWTGAIWYKSALGASGSSYSFPYTNIEVLVTGAAVLSLTPPSATVTFSGGGAPNRVRSLKSVSPWFHNVEFEFDHVGSVVPVTSMQTHAHPNRPPTLRNEVLTIERVYSRAGFDVAKSGRDSTVPLTGAGADVLWSDGELHDAMQTYWSRFANYAQWSMWALFASKHEAIPSQGIGPDDLGGLMFDDIGPNHRQGTAIFNDSFIKDAPAGDSAPTAYVRRTRFWTAVHEIGHTFNLAHSWQKSLGSGSQAPWQPLSDEPEARSFMNYPYRVGGGQTAFFADFEFRFSDSELRFMRHAPQRFVEMGNADWFDHHGFQQANLSPEPRLQLELSFNRGAPLFEFMEPVMLEVTLTNTSDEPQLLQDNILFHQEDMTIIIKRHNRPARQLFPYAQYCERGRTTIVMPGQSKRQSFCASFGKGGWLIEEAGLYTVQIALHLDDEDVISNPVRLRIAPPRGYDEEFLAQEFFTDEVARVLAFDGSRYFESSNDTLRAIVEKLSDRRVSLHARVALALPYTRKYKQLTLSPDPHDRLRPASEIGGRITVSEPNTDEASKYLSAALIDHRELAAETLGTARLEAYSDRFSKFLGERGELKQAAVAKEKPHRARATRRVRPRA